MQTQPCVRVEPPAWVQTETDKAAEKFLLGASASGKAVVERREKGEKLYQQPLR
jgi:hypothetical protein